MVTSGTSTRRLMLGRPSGFLNLGSAGAGGGVSSGLSFFLGSAMDPLSPPGPPAAGAVWSGCGWPAAGCWVCCAAPRACSCASTRGLAVSAQTARNAATSETFCKTFSPRRSMFISTSRAHKNRRFASPAARGNGTAPGVSKATSLAELAPPRAIVPCSLYSYIDVRTSLQASLGAGPKLACAFAFVLAATPGALLAQTATAAAGPPQNPAIFPLGEVHRGLTGTAWTVFEGDTPEPMQVEILGVLRGARGPGQDMILARLHGAKPEYTGVVEGMSGSPVYIDGKLLGSLSYRIGIFSKEPIAGITPIKDLLEVRDLAAHDSQLREAASTSPAIAAPTALASLLAAPGTAAASFGSAALS